jgi:maleylpyruvate isomerase
MILYSYFRSSAAFRVRIALNLKGLAFDHASVHLLKDGGQQFSDAYREINQTGLVPTLGVGDQFLRQSLAIIEYLEEAYPDPPLLPAEPLDRAYVRSIALDIACEIHPQNNLRVLNYLKDNQNISEIERMSWYRHWIMVGFQSLEAGLSREARVGNLVYGDQPTIADLCLVPQVFNARRFDIDLSLFPIISRVADYAMTIEAFRLAAPALQSDAE